MIIWRFLGKFGCFVCCALCAEGKRKGQKQRPSLSSHGGKICRYRCPCTHSLTRKKKIPDCILNRRLTCDKKLFSTFFYVHNLRNAITTKEMQFKRVIVYLSDFFPFSNTLPTKPLLLLWWIKLRFLCPKYSAPNIVHYSNLAPIENQEMQLDLQGVSY